MTTQTSNTMKMLPTKFQMVVALLFAVQPLQAARVPCQLELKLDDTPEEVAWEIRGPHPSMEMIAEVYYQHYGRDKVNAVVNEHFVLEDNHEYVLVMVDGGGDGLKAPEEKKGETSVMVACRFGAYERVLLAHKGDYGEGKVFRFSVQRPEKKNKKKEEAWPVSGTDQTSASGIFHQ